MRVLLTNDDGIDAEGLQALRRALLEVPGDRPARRSRRTATARRSGAGSRRASRSSSSASTSTTARHGYATDGTPVDCVRLAALGLVDGWMPEIVVAGINHGANLGDDVTYSGTVAAAFEGLVLGLPAIAVSQQSTRARDGLPPGPRVRLRARRALRRARRRGARGRAAAALARCSTSTSRPASPTASRSPGWASGSTATSSSSTRSSSPERRRYWIYGAEPGLRGRAGHRPRRRPRRADRRHARCTST